MFAEIRVHEKKVNLHSYHGSRGFTHLKCAPDEYILDLSEQNNLLVPSDQKSRLLF